MGFTTYITPEPPAPPTLLERIAALSGAQKLTILAAYEVDKKPDVLKHDVAVAKDLIVAIYEGIDGVRSNTKAIVREEVLLVEGTYDEEGNEITPPEYNVAPTSVADLKAEVALSFTDTFTSAEVGAIIDKMIEWSEVDQDGNPIGTAAVWAVEVLK